jgi:copper chaperone CopZ
MATVTETFLVSGIRCERCVLRLANALEDQPGLDAAHATLMGEVTLTWDDDLTTREALGSVLSSSGFHEMVDRKLA